MGPRPAVALSRGPDLPLADLRVGPGSVRGWVALGLAVPATMGAGVGVLVGYGRGSSGADQADDPTRAAPSVASLGDPRTADPCSLPTRPR